MDEKQLSDEERYLLRRAKRREQMKLEKRRQELLRRRIKLWCKLAAVLTGLIAVAVFGISILKKAGWQTEHGLFAQDRAKEQSGAGFLDGDGLQDMASDGEEADGNGQDPDAPAPGESFAEGSGQDFGEEYGTAEGLGQQTGTAAERMPFFQGYAAKMDDSTPYLANEEVKSNYAILVDLDTGRVLAQKNANTVINPASMTKILTLLVAAEHLTDLDQPFTMTIEITDYAYVNDCSAAGFAKDETVTVRDLMYGTILPSGGEAAAALAIATAGSLEAFTDLMNEKLEELGLSSTAHVTNCIGLYDENHHCTVYDMAMILKAAVENELCYTVLSAHTFTTMETEEHPEGINLSNLFLRRIEDKDTHGEVVCAKTGFVNESGNCGASYAVSNEGKHYICVTGDAWSAWRCIYDHVAIYQQYTK